MDMKSHISVALLLGGALLASCDAFEKNAVQDIVGPTPTTARIKFHNFSVNSVGVNFFANGEKMTAVGAGSCTPLPTVDSLRTKCLAAGIESATGVVYGTCTAGACSGGSVAGGLYIAVEPGQYTLTAKMAAKDTIVSTVAQTIEDGKYYSFFMSGIYDVATKTSEAFIIEDPVPSSATVDYTTAQVRFVNAVPNGTATLNLFATNTTTNIEGAAGGAVAYKAAGTFTSFPAGVYNLRAAYTGGANLITRNTVSFVGGRIYTVTVRGSALTAATLGLDNTENQR